MNRNQQILILISFLLANCFVFGQQEIVIPVEWEKPQSVTIDEREMIIPRIKDQGYENGQPAFFWSKSINTSSSFIFSFLGYESEICSQEDKNFIETRRLEVADEFNPSVVIRDGGSEKFAVVHFFPYVRTNGTYRRVTSVRVSLTETGKIAKTIKPKGFASSSVLRQGTGTWYKISVREDGIYKLDKAFLEACGISTSGLNPNHINIFGNGEGMLPESNGVFRTDDLAKNAIQIVGGNDGSFDDADYILFYGWGPHRWYANGTVDYDRRTNIYSDDSFYFLNINSNDSPLRMDVVNSSTAPPTHTVDQVDFYQTIESDVTNLVNAGQRWYGDLFDIELSRTYNFLVPNVVSSSPVRFKIAMAGKSSGTNNRIKVFGGGNELLSVAAPNGFRDYGRIINTFSMNNPTANIGLTVNLTRTNPNTIAYLDFLTVNARRDLRFFGNEMSFRDLRSVGSSNVAKYNLSAVNSSVAVWDITNRQQPRIVQGQLIGSTFEFTLLADTIREFVASNGLGYRTPTLVGAVSNQNLHGLSQADLLIVSPSAFLTQANRLADLHRGEGLTVHVVTEGQIFNEFSSGMRDAVAIRFFAKMFYDRATNVTERPKHMLLFGDGTFDHRNRVSNANFIMTYQVPTSEDHVDALVSDDFFAILGDDESFSSVDMVDIGIGRLLISSNEIATQQVNKIEHYMKNGSNFYSTPGVCDCSPSRTTNTFGDWRLRYVQIADDPDLKFAIPYDFVTRDMEPQSAIVESYRKEMNVDKIYMDAFPQVSGAGGQRYPSVNEAITDRKRRGALVVNYVGHGGEAGAADERIITIPQIESWKNANAFSLFVSATCEFTKYDDPDRVSAGELVALNPNGGAIALMTTTRPVFFSVNSDTGLRFYEQVFQRDSDSLPSYFGDIMKNTKNNTGATDNKRSFTLIGDPALRLAMPRLTLKTDSIYRVGSTNMFDTVRALDKITLVGHVEDLSGNILNNFKGIVTPTIFDKPKKEFTLANDAGAPITGYFQQKNALFRGQATVENGYFKITFVVPKDIDFTIGNGKVSMYGHDNTTDAMGYDNRVVIGGINPNGLDDDRGPDIELFMNDYTFVDGGLTDERPIFLAKLFDENGINAVGNGIGHDLTAILDQNTANPIILNEFYLSDLNTFQSGIVNYNMPKLEPGKHSITFKAWDVNNNSSERTIEFVVQEKETPELSNVLNYPNPFTTSTQFFFEHNQVNTALESQIQIFTISGKLVKTINTLVNTQGFRTEGIPWDGKDDFGDQLAKGVYVYRVSIRTDSGGTAEKLEKLVILK